jgi:hypothetical protein
MDSPSTPSEETPLFGLAPVSGSNESNTESDVEDGNDNYDHFVDIPDSEFNRPWPTTFERSISLLAGPISDADFIEEITKSPKITPNIGVRRMVRYPNCQLPYQIDFILHLYTSHVTQPSMFSDKNLFIVFHPKLPYDSKIQRPRCE